MGERTATRSAETWQHDHTFGQDVAMPGERRTIIVIAITAVMMVVEIGAGVMFGSMALLADGLHMASHAVALAISAFAYIYARRHARDERFNFGTGKVNALGGFSGAVLLAVFALIMTWESVGRFFNPVTIKFNQAIIVATLGLIVNAISAVILGGPGGHSHDHGHDGREGSQGGHKHHHSDHNLRAAYLHVMADALTSVLAIAALLAGKFFGLAWMDPFMGIVGAILVANWSVGLIRMTSRVLLDRQGPKQVHEAIRAVFEGHDGVRITDLHVWSIGPDKYATIISIATGSPEPADRFKAMLPEGIGLAHVTVEVNVDGRASDAQDAHG